jgi:surface protein
MQTFNARLCVVALALGAVVSAVGSDAAAPVMDTNSLKAAVDDCLGTLSAPRSNTVSRRLDTSSGKDPSGSDCFLQGDGSACSTAGPDCYFISDWDVSGVTGMYELFNQQYDFNQDIGNWDVSSVRDMRYTFGEASAFNQDISRWDVSSVTETSFMFIAASSFNQDISRWDVSSLRNAYAMFKDCTSFNQPIGDWDVSAMAGCGAMFEGATSFNQPIGNWDMSNVEEAAIMFKDATSFNQPIGNWDMSSVTYTSGMFSGATSFNQPIGDWDVRNLESCGAMFEGATSFNQPIGNWNTASMTTTITMFKDATSFNQPIGNWDVSNVLWMAYTFQGATSFNQDIGDWDVRNVQWMPGMFKGAKAYDHDGILKWNTEYITEWIRSGGVRPGYASSNFDALEVNVGNMFMDADAWLASHQRVANGVMIADDGDLDYDIDYTYWSDYDPARTSSTEVDTQHDLSTFGPPSFWIRISSQNASLSSGEGGSDGASGSDFPEWGIALAGVALGISTVTSIFFLIQKLCCSGPKHHPILTYATQPSLTRV